MVCAVACKSIVLTHGAWIRYDYVWTHYSNINEDEILKSLPEKLQSDLVCFWF